MMGFRILGAPYPTHTALSREKLCRLHGNQFSTFVCSPQRIKTILNIRFDGRCRMMPLKLGILPIESNTRA
jgi:hypothetical protein